MKFRIEYGDPTDPCVKYKHGDDAVIEPTGPDGGQRVTVFKDTDEGPDAVFSAAVAPPGMVAFDVVEYQEA